MKLAYCPRDITPRSSHFARLSSKKTVSACPIQLDTLKCLTNEKITSIKCPYFMSASQRQKTPLTATATHLTSSCVGTHS